jgi:hypothetical protein
MSPVRRHRDSKARELRIDYDRNIDQHGPDPLYLGVHDFGLQERLVRVKAPHEI